MPVRVIGTVSVSVNTVVPLSITGAGYRRVKVAVTVSLRAEPPAGSANHAAVRTVAERSRWIGAA